MPQLLVDAWDRLAAAAHLVADEAVSVDLGWLALGVVVHFAAVAIRTRGWHTILKAAYPDSPGLRARNTCAAFLAGSGVNAVVPARGGDAVKLFLVRRRIDDARWSTLAATFVPETLFETLLGVSLVVWGLSRGFLPVPTSTGELPQLDVTFVLDHPVQAAAGAAALAIGGTLLVRVARRHVTDLRARLAQGVAILGDPRRFVTGVASWQLLGRVIRLGSLAALMAAFGLPVTPETVLLVMAAQGGGRIIPLAPASAGLRLLMLTYGFAELGEPVDIAALTVFTAGVGAVLLLGGLLLGAAALAAELDTTSWRRVREALRSASGSGPASRPAPGGTGR
jgi:uncharacterized membrane protein YbhN (UPF0104 family)